MGGVDLLSRVIIPYSIQREGGNKWYKKIGNLFTELSVSNASIVLKNLDNSVINQLTFSQQPIEEIITVHLSGQPKLSAGCTELSSKNSSKQMRKMCVIK